MSRLKAKEQRLKFEDYQDRRITLKKDKFNLELQQATNTKPIHAATKAFIIALKSEMKTVKSNINYETGQVRGFLLNLKNELNDKRWEQTTRGYMG